MLNYEIPLYFVQFRTIPRTSFEIFQNSPSPLPLLRFSILQASTRSPSSRIHETRCQMRGGSWRRAIRMPWTLFSMKRSAKTDQHQSVASPLEIWQVGEDRGWGGRGGWGPGVYMGGRWNWQSVPRNFESKPSRVDTLNGRMCEWMNAPRSIQPPASLSLSLSVSLPVSLGLVVHEINESRANTSWWDRRGDWVDG